MNIVILAEFVVKSGVGVYVDSLCKAMRGKDITAYIIADQYVFEDNSDVFYKRNFSKVDFGSLLKNIKYLRKFFKEKSIEAVEINHRRCGFLMKIYNIVYWYDKMPCVWVLHTERVPSSFFYRLVTYKGKKVIAISEEVKSHLINKLRISPNRIVKILNGVDSENLTRLSDEEITELKKKYGVPEDKIVLCMHGRIDKVKGIDVTLKAISALDKTLLDKVVVVLSGVTENNTYYTEIMQLIDSLDLKGNVRFTGWITPREILSMSDICIAPSRREGFLLTAVEVFFLKVPLIRTYMGGYTDMREVCCGIAIDDWQGLSDKIADFVKDRHMYDEMVERAYRFASSNCTLDVMADKTIAVFEGVRKK